MSEWIKCSERMPKSGETVLAAYRNHHGNWRRICAQWIKRHTVEASPEFEEGVAQYDDDTDTYYLVEGWWERIDNWDDYYRVLVHEGTPTHWQPLPQPPEDAR